MLKATLRSILSAKGRVVATAFAVVLGIAFLAGTLILTDTTQSAFDQLFSDVFERTDAQVRSTETIDAGFGNEVRSRIDQSVLDDVRAVDGVAVADGFVQGFAQVIGSDGEPVGNPNQGPPTFGFSWGEDAELNSYSIADGRAPTGPTEVVLDLTTAEAAMKSLGDTVQIVSASGAREFTIVGLAKFGDSGSLAGATAALFDLETAQSVLDAAGKLDAISVRADDGLSQEEITARLNRELTGTTEAITGEAAAEEAQSSIAAALSFFNGFLLAFALIALFVSAFVITNTFAILVAQRSRELALLRAIGATRSQVLRSVLAESLVIGVVGSILGLLAGIGLSYGLRAMLSAIGLDLPGGGILLQNSTIVVSLVVGTGVTVLAAVLPAWRASRIAPIEALRQSAAEPWERNRTRFLAGLLVLTIGAFALLYGLLVPKLMFAGIGAAVLFIGVFVLGPAIAKPVAGVISLPVAKFRGVTGTMARENTLRNPKRTARTASALTIGVALVAGVTVLTASLKTSIENTIGESFVGDFVLDSGSFGPQSGLSGSVIDELGAVPGVDKAAGFQIGLGEMNGDGDFFAVFDPTATFDFIDVGIISGEPADLTPGSIFVLDNKADDLGVDIGDTITAQFPSTDELTLTVAGLYTEAAYPGNFIVNTTDYNVAGSEELYAQAFVQLANGAVADDVKPALEDIAADYPNATLQDRETYIEEQGAALNQILGLFYVMLVMAIIIAAFGIMNTLRLSVLERTREIGLMRAVGMTRRQLRSTIRWESVITAVFGAVLGVVLGLFLGYSIVVALRDQGSIAFTVPWVSLLVVVLLAAVVGVLAAIWPARKAAKMNVLEAIATE